MYTYPHTYIHCSIPCQIHVSYTYVYIHTYIHTYIHRYMPTEDKRQQITALLSSYFQDLPLSFRKAEEYPWLLSSNAAFWVQSVQPSEYRRVWRRVRDVVADMDVFLALYTDEFVGDLHDYWRLMEGVYDLVDEYLLSLDIYKSKGGSSGETERIMPTWHLAKCQTALARFFVDSGR